MELVGVRIELPTNSPILLLREVGGTRYLPIWIGANEATAIALALEGVEPQRPMTHDLMRSMLDSLEATVERVVITELQEGTYFADLVLLSNGEPTSVSARPSDAVAIAVRTSSPVFAERELLEDAGVEIRDEDDEEMIEKFREFLEDISPEDFTAGS
ncbi:MAG: bifunctional nuclease family protein [Acidimicrobiia bacterium]|nr:bifunctional nuclease family protein [Acidimicrobiia bacterium]NNF69906.1 bifunctional nuclease family protein [Acidimicrobiia bacterium]